MRKFWTRFGTLALLLVVMVSFTACSLFTENLDKKYSSRINVASAENSDLTVSRQELYYAYITWGYQYANYYESEADLLEYLAESILNEKILAQISLEKFGALRDSEKALARKNVFTSFDNSLRQYTYEILNMDDPEQASKENESADKVEYKPFEKVINVQDGIFALNLDSYQDQNGKLVLSNYQKYTPTFPSVATEKVARQAMSKIIRNLKSVENGFTNLAKPKYDYLDTSSVYTKYLSSSAFSGDCKVINREIERMLEANERSILASRLSIAYNLGFANLSGKDARKAWDAYLTRGENFQNWQEILNSDVRNEDGYVLDENDVPVAWGGCANVMATDIAHDVKEFYLNKVRSAINGYAYSTEAEIRASVVGASLGDLYYIPHNVAQGLYTVSHILIGFTDEQKAQFTKIKNEAEKNPAYNPEADYNKLYAATSSNGKNVFDIYNEVVAGLNAADTLQAKYELFRDYIYQYNTDPGMQNPEYEYLMSNVSSESKMIAEFTAASIDLYNKGVKGAVSELVWGEYGAHIIMYTRDVSDFICTIDPAMLDFAYQKTLYATTTAYGNKTKFDALVGYFNRNYSSYQNHLLIDFKSEHQVFITKTDLKDFI